MWWPLPKMGFLYYLLRFLFRAGIFVFYHSVQVVNRDALLRLNSPVLLLVNHSNSLMDAAVVLTASAPKAVVMTAKDTLWKHKFWGYFMRGTGSVPFQRADDHGKGADNRGAFSAISDALDNNACIAVFPEGRSRYLPHLLPLRSGAAHIALSYALESLGEDEDEDKDKVKKVAILPCGITYLHREKFRSDVLVEYGKPVFIDKDTVRIPNAGDEEHELVLSTAGQPQHDLAKTVTKYISQQMQRLTLASPDWKTLALAHCARKLARPPPKDCYLTLREHVVITRAFITLFDEKDEKDEEKIMLMRDMSVYMKELGDLGLKDERVSSFGSTVHLWEKTSLIILGRILFRLISFIPYALFILPGIFCLLPLMLWVRYEEWRILRKPGGVQMNKDELAQYKMAYAVVVPGVTIFTASVAVGYMYSSWITFITSNILLLLYVWLTVRGLEDMFANARAIYSLFKLLRHGKKLESIRSLRSNLSQRLTELADQHNVPQVNGRYYHIWEYFNPLRRRKKDWNEVLRLGEELPGI